MSLVPTRLPQKLRSQLHRALKKSCVPFLALTLPGFYNRSLRAHDDVAGFSFTLLLKALPRSEATF